MHRRAGACRHRGFRRALRWTEQPSELPGKHTENPNQIDNPPCPRSNFVRDAALNTFCAPPSRSTTPIPHRRAKARMGWWPRWSKPVEPVGSGQHESPPHPPPATAAAAPSTSTMSNSSAAAEAVDGLARDRPLPRGEGPSMTILGASAVGILGCGTYARLRMCVYYGDGGMLNRKGTSSRDRYDRLISDVTDPSSPRPHDHPRRARRDHGGHVPGAAQRGEGAAGQAAGAAQAGGAGQVLEAVSVGFGLMLCFVESP